MSVSPLQSINTYCFISFFFIQTQLFHWASHKTMIHILQSFTCRWPLIKFLCPILYYVVPMVATSNKLLYSIFGRTCFHYFSPLLLGLQQACTCAYGPAFHRGPEAKNLIHTWWLQVNAIRTYLQPSNDFYRPFRANFLSFW